MDEFNPNSPPPGEEPRFDPNTPPPEVSPIERKLDQAYKFYSEHADEYWGRTSAAYLEERIPAVNIGAAIGHYFNLSGAIKGMKSGKPSDDDINTLAQFKARQDYEAKKSGGGQAVDMLTKVPALAAEFAASGGAGTAVRGAAGGAVAKLAARGLAGEAAVAATAAASKGLAARAAGYGAGLATQAALTPSLYMDHAVNANLAEDRDPLDPRGLPGAYGLALAQMAVLGEVGRQTGKAFTGSGLKQAAGRIGVQAASGPFAQAATDIVTSAIGLDSGYGNVGKLIRGESGEALQSALMDALTFGAFGAAHEVVHGGKGRGEVMPVSEKTKELFTRKIVELLDEQAKKGATPDQAAAVVKEEVRKQTEIIHQEAQGPTPGIDELSGQNGQISGQISPEASVKPKVTLEVVDSNVVNPPDTPERATKILGVDRPPEAPVAPLVSPTLEVAQKPAEVIPVAPVEAKAPEATETPAILPQTTEPSPKAKDFMERIRARQAGVDVATPGGKVQEVRPGIHEPEGKDSIKGAPHLNSDIYDLRSLDKNERAALDGMIVDGLSTRKLAKAGILTGGKSHEHARGVAIKALEKMGVTLPEGAKLTPANVQKAAAAEAQRRLLAKAGLVTPGELKFSDAEVAAQARQRAEDNETLAGRWATYIVEKSKNEPDGWWSPEKLAEFNEAIGRGENPPGYDEAQQAKGKGQRLEGKEVVSKFIAPEEHNEVITQAKRTGRTAAQAEELVRQVEDEVAKQLQEEIRAAGADFEPWNATTGGPPSTATDVDPSVFFHKGIGGAGGTPKGHAGKRPPPAAGGIPEPGLIDDLKAALAPATRGKHAETGGQLIKHGLAIMARQKAVAQEHLKAAEKYFDAYIVAQPDAVREQRFADFFRPIQQGKINQLPQELQPFAQAIRDLFDERTDGVVNRNIVQNTVDNYITQLWKKPGAKQGEGYGRRPLAGKEGFKKQRVFMNIDEGLQAGREPVDWNPARFALQGLTQIDKSIMAHDVVQELGKRGLWHYVGLGQKHPEGWTKIPDKAATVFAPGEVKLTEYHDKQQMDKLDQFMANLNIHHERVVKGLGGAVGQAQTGGGQPDSIITKFATPEEIKMHEVGHVLDSRYNMQAWLQDPIVAKELTDLADLRASGRVDPNYKAYLRSDPERMANLVAAYLHAPELLNQVAPNAMAHFESLIASKPELKPLRDIKPSLELDSREQMMRLAGPILTGHFYTPEPIARIMTNYLQPGLRGWRPFDAIREFGNIQNLFQLGFGAFHAGFVTVDTQMSAVALGLQQISRGEFLKGLKKVALGPIAPIRNFTEGSKMMKEYFAPGSQGAEYAELIDAHEKAGGRMKQEEFYGGTHISKLRESLAKAKRGDKAAYGGVLYQALPALAEGLSKPTMEILVPKIKAGVFADMARDFKERFPNATPDQERAHLQKEMDSVDNRLGQLTYDNVFWNRTLKDVLMAGIRSVGWNVGTIREVVGGVKDIPKSLKGIRSGEGITSKTAYITGMVMVSGLYGAIYQAVATGKWPEELKDYFFPKTGRTRPDGTADRKSLPSYMRDVAHATHRADEGPLRIAQNVGEMAKGKLNPGVVTLSEMLFNDSFYGAIRNPNDSMVKQATDTAKFLLESFEPFTTRSFRQANQKGQGIGDMAQAVVGITPAPSYVTKSSQQQREEELKRKVVLTPLAKKLKAR